MSRTKRWREYKREMKDEREPERKSAGRERTKFREKIDTKEK